MNNKKVILIDLDGVLNEYQGDFDKEFIPPMREGVYEFLEKLYENFEIKIFTTRNKLLTAKWLIQNEIDKFILDITNTKDLAFLYVDDRCIRFNSDYLKIIDEIINFKIWYKK